MTRRLWSLGLTLAGCGCLLAGLSLAADAKKDDAKDDQPAQAEPDEQGDAVALIGLATKLEDFGNDREQKKEARALALVTAASLLRQVKPPTEGKEQPKTEGGSREDKPQPFDEDALRKQSDKLLEKAKDLAKNDATIQDLAHRVAEEKPRTRGGLNGPMEFHMSLRRGQTDTYNLKFKKNAWVRIALRQEGGSNLYVEARNGRGDIRSTDAGHNPVLGFMPHGNDGSDYIIKVKNNGPGDTYYFLFTN